MNTYKLMLADASGNVIANFDVVTNETDGFWDSPESDDVYDLESLPGFLVHEVKVHERKANERKASDPGQLAEVMAALFSRKPPEKKMRDLIR